jgi:Protein of unknown function (DUF664)
VTPPRTIPPMEADERATLAAFLDWQRATLALKCEGLADDQLRERLDGSTGELYPERAWFPDPAHLTAAPGRDPARPARRPPATPPR